MKAFTRLLCVLVVCVSLSLALPTRATPLLQPPVFTGTFRLMAIAQSGDTVAYALAPRHGGGMVSVQGAVTIFTAFSRHTVNSLAVALVNANTPVVAWSDRAGIHSGIWHMGPLGFPAWFYTQHGIGRNPQLLTNPLRLAYFVKAQFTCVQWTGSAWQTGCES